MGFLDHTTNSIVIDAVLTERGRELLARNDSSFKIDAFSVGDDEIDYSNITKYGIRIGKEKIEKNTPIFEAQTNENLALKHNNISLLSSNIKVLYIPKLHVYSPDNVASGESIVFNFNSSVPTPQTIKILSTLPSEAGQTEINPNLADNLFFVRMNSQILSLYNSTGDAKLNRLIDEDENFVSTYQKSAEHIPGTGLTGNYNFALTNRYMLTIDVGLVTNMNNSFFSKFGTLQTNGNQITGTINTYIEVLGKNSRANLIIPVTINLQN